MALDMDKLNSFVGQFVGDLGAAVHSGMVVIGEKLGLYKALAEGPLNSVELAAKTRTDERYVREWLASQAAGGYITYNEQTRKFSLSEEQAFTRRTKTVLLIFPEPWKLAAKVALAATTGSLCGFRQTDPMWRPPAHPDSRWTTRVPAPAAARFVGEKLLRVLVADDHDDMRNCIVKILSEEFEVIGAVSDGYELINAAILRSPMPLSVTSACLT